MVNKLKWLFLAFFLMIAMSQQQEGVQNLSLTNETVEFQDSSIKESKNNQTNTKNDQKENKIQDYQEYDGQNQTNRTKEQKIEIEQFKNTNESLKKDKDQRAQQNLNNQSSKGENSIEKSNNEGQVINQESATVINSSDNTLEQVQKEQRLEQNIVVQIVDNKSQIQNQGKQSAKDIPQTVIQGKEQVKEASQTAKQGKQQVKDATQPKDAPQTAKQVQLPGQYLYPTIQLDSVILSQPPSIPHIQTQKQFLNFSQILDSNQDNKLEQNQPFYLPVDSEGLSEIFQKTNISKQNETSSSVPFNQSQISTLDSPSKLQRQYKIFQSQKPSLSAIQSSDQILSTKIQQKDLTLDTIQGGLSVSPTFPSKEQLQAQLKNLETSFDSEEDFILRNLGENGYLLIGGIAATIIVIVGMCIKFRKKTREGFQMMSSSAEEFRGSPI